MFYLNIKFAPLCPLVFPADSTEIYHFIIPGNKRNLLIVTGDELIKSTEKILRSVFNSEHVVSRTGGDEFVIIVKNNALVEVERLYQKLQTDLEQYNKSNNHMPINISIGLAYSETSINSMESTLNIADRNMYKNKRKKQI